MAKNKLSSIELDEVSLVDRPANQFSKVVLFKREEGLTPDEEVEFGKVVRQEGAKWKLYSLDGSKVLGEFESKEEAIAREKQIKGWLRAKKIALIESVNPGWKDLSEEWH